MQKSLFAGLTVLSPDESILSDDGAFIGRDRETIDRFLEIGAKTHRHTGLPGIANPGLPLQDVQAIPSGGTIAADVTFTLGYSVVDSDGGETMLSPTTVVTTPPALEQPLLAPTAVIDYGDGGTLLIETYYYTLTYIDAEGGETPPGAWAQVEREPGFPNARVLLSGLANGIAAASAVGWRLYRAVGGGTFDFLASGGSATDTYADDGSISVNCDVHPPPDELNTTNNINQLRVVLPSAISASAASLRLYGTNTGAFLGDVFLGAYPTSSAGHTDFFTSFNPQPGAPPDRNHSIGGASKVDPDTEILDWHWKRPVDSAAQLASGEYGDVRLNRGNGDLYAMLRNPSGFGVGQWTRIAVGSGSAVAGGSGGGGGGGGIGTLHEVFGPNPRSAYALYDPFDTDSVTAGKWAFENTGIGGALPVVKNGHLTAAAGQTNYQVSRTDVAGIGNQTYTLKWHTGGDAAGQLQIQTKFRYNPNRYTLMLFLADGFNMVFQKAVNSNTVYSQVGANGPFTTLQPDKDYWVQISVNGNVVEGKVFDKPPLPGIAPLYSHSITLGGTDATNFGTGVTGTIGLTAYSPASDPQSEYVDDILVTPYGGYTDDVTPDIALEKERLQFRASGAAGVAVRASAASAIVTISPPGRRWTSAALNLSSGASGLLDFAPSAAGVSLAKISVSKRSRVRLYGASGDRATDAARPYSTPPVLPHGVLLDYPATFNASGMIAPLAPVVGAFNLDNPAQNKLYLTIENYDDTGQVVVAFLLLPTEIV